jgi:tetratricopeptide (TPR) repeat protein
VEAPEVKKRLKAKEQRHLTAALGYCDLEMYQEANDALDEMHPFARLIPEVLVVRTEIYSKLEAWELMRTTALRLTRQLPDEPIWVHRLAHATRRAVSVEAASLFLLDAAERFPSDGLIRYNLACYESVLNNFPQAQSWLEEAFTLDNELRLTALDDEDLQPYWKWMGTL